MLPLLMGWTFFFSGFSKMQGVPLSWQRRQGACRRAEPGRAAGRARSARVGGQRKTGTVTHFAFTAVLALAARSARARAALRDVARRGRELRDVVHAHRQLLRWLLGRGGHVVGAVGAVAGVRVVGAAPLGVVVCVRAVVGVGGGRRRHRRRGKGGSNGPRPSLARPLSPASAVCMRGKKQNESRRPATGPRDHLTTLPQL